MAGLSMPPVKCTNNASASQSKATCAVAMKCSRISPARRVMAQIAAL